MLVGMPHGKLPVQKQHGFRFYRDARQSCLCGIQDGAGTDDWHVNAQFLTGFRRLVENAATRNAACTAQ